jgi:hypothetical protein
VGGKDSTRYQVRVRMNHQELSFHQPGQKFVAQQYTRDYLNKNFEKKMNSNFNNFSDKDVENAQIYTLGRTLLYLIFDPYLHKYEYFQDQDSAEKLLKEYNTEVEYLNQEQAKKNALLE